MKPLRFGICGCGGIAGVHAECIRVLEGMGLAKLVAGAEAEAARRESFGTKWGIPMHETLEALLQRDDVDAVTICSPSGLHGRQASQCAASKKHVLCEKPLDTRVERADEAIATAQRNGVVLGGIFQQRFSPAAVKVKKAIEQGYFGQIVLAHCETPWYRDDKYYGSGAWRGTWDMDGGVLSNQAPHMIDRMMWLGGDVEQIISATCDAGKLRKIEAETVAVATARLKTGALATITGTTLAYDGLPQRVMICGTEGSAALDNDEMVHFKTLRPFQYDDSLLAKPLPKENQGRDPLAMSIRLHLANIQDFVMAIGEKRQPLVTGQDLRNVTWVLNSIYQNAGVGPYASK